MTNIIVDKFTSASIYTFYLVASSANDTIGSQEFQITTLVPVLTVTDPLIDYNQTGPTVVDPILANDTTQVDAEQTTQTTSASETTQTADQVITSTV